MKDINEALTMWALTYGRKKGFLGGMKAVDGWKWPTKAELRKVTGGSAEEFEEALEVAVDNGWVLVRNGRVGLHSSEGRDALGRRTIGEGSF